MAIVVYVDESGVHSNRYLVIAAIITNTEQSRKRIKRLMGKKLVKYRSEDMHDEIHAYHLDTAQKQDILTALSGKHDYQVAYIVADKNHLTEELKKRSNLCYNYLFSLLTKKLVASFANEDITIISDDRTVSAGSKNSLPEYIKTQAYAEWGYAKNLELVFLDSKSSKGLQAVDVVSNAIYANYNLGKNHLYNIHSGYYIERINFPYRKFGT